MTTTPAKPDPGRVLPPNPRQAAIVVGSLTLLLWLIELVDVALPADLDLNGIIPRALAGLDGIIWMPFLHGGWGHLISNTLPFAVLGFLVMAGGLGQWAAVTGTIWFTSGVGVWLTGAAGSVHVGASGIVFGWMLFLLVRGVFARSFRQLLVAVALLAYWGTMLFGVLPGDPRISWQGHLFGALGGVLAAWLVSVANRQVAVRS
ncbi:MULTISPECIES: rhomboid family intramembrane serine protease [Actinokineospora]|uniref:Rhomboid family intramembrane serine protease n=1 Tax=Actinokineospora fastidiosa TaxID=1816 RepID=A0A918LFL0_9PSEU|nr:MULTISPECIES: rhomboid family intramembrane serine protease [Actinokineospora]UVS77452.1 rhombosortase [Actinokineospora sp. UTMC 2448]GGS43211.1 rhomboid family intramembrane serine protease [Actinokineospora fastidiosa]